jgi:hypothetical protein
MGHLKMTGNGRDGRAITCLGPDIGRAVPLKYQSNY